MNMTDNEALDLDKLIEDAKVLTKEKDTLARTFRNFKDYGNPKSTITSGAEKAQKEAVQYEHISKLFEELKAYRAIGTIDQINKVIHFLDLENDNGLINDMTLLNQYRAIGTVEALQDMKTNYYEALSDWRQYRKIGTIEELKALKEKSVAKKPEPIDYEKYMEVLENAKFLRGAYWCPNCKHTVRSGTYCDDCGQKLDWREEE